MKASWIDASRRGEVREAASAWREAGAIDADTLSAIQRAYPGERLRLALAWRILIFVLVSVAVHAVFSSVFVFAGTESIGASCLIYGVALAVATEALHGSRLAGTGCDAATSLWAATYLILGFTVVLVQNLRIEDHRVATLSLLCACLVFGAACWRWGYEAYGVLGTAAVFLFLARFDGARLLWVLIAALAIGAIARQLDRAAFAPPHRRSFGGVLAVSALALYAAANRFSLDQKLIEALKGDAQQATGPAAATRILSNVATAVLPVLLIAWGIRARRALVLDLGVACAALSLVTLRYYVHLAPLWIILVACGAALILTALSLNRYLRRAPGGERSGFTASPLFAGRRVETVQAAAFVAGFTPPAAGATGADQGKFSGGGGEFGGGGSSGTF